MRLAQLCALFAACVHAQGGTPSFDSYPFSGCVLASDLQTACVKKKKTFFFFFFFFFPLTFIFCVRPVSARVSLTRNQVQGFV
jgi:hypothetical protein